MGHINPQFVTPDVVGYVGHAVDAAQALPGHSVDCAISSPPYYMARAYAGDQGHVFGGDPQHQHLWQCFEWGFAVQGPASLEESSPGAPYAGHAIPYWECACGAWRGQLGLEPSVELYVDHLVLVLRELKRVLKPTGVLWLNLGDTMARGSTPNDYREDLESTSGLQGSPNRGNTLAWKPPKHAYLKPGDKFFVPHRVAIALQQDGWVVCQDVVWVSANRKPESVKRRPSKVHEYLFLCAPKEGYWYDKYGWAELVKPESLLRYRYQFHGRDDLGRFGQTEVNGHREPPLFVNARSVWDIPAASYEGAHFAVMPDELAERCLLLGCPAWCCEKCGRPWKRRVVVEQVYDSKRKREVPKRRDMVSGTPSPRSDFEPACKCGVGTVPGTSLDPFGGTGTVAAVSRSHGRRSIYVDCSAEYAHLAQRRIEQVTLPLHASAPGLKEPGAGLFR